MACRRPARRVPVLQHLGQVARQVVVERAAVAGVEQCRPWSIASSGRLLAAPLAEILRLGQPGGRLFDVADDHAVQALEDVVPLAAVEVADFDGVGVGGRHGRGVAGRPQAAAVPLVLLVGVEAVDADLNADRGFSPREDSFPRQGSMGPAPPD